MIMYPPGAGGDFFCTLFAMAHPSTLKIMIPESFDKDGKRYHGDIPSYWNILPEFGERILRYKPPNYIHSPIILLKTIEETVGWLRKEDPAFPHSIKHILYTSILNYMRGQRIYPQDPETGEALDREAWMEYTKKELGRILILNPTHQNTFAKADYPKEDRVWTTLNITPKTEAGIGVCTLGHQVLFDRRRLNEGEWDRLEGKGDRSFPFMDYMVEQNFDEIIDFGLMHYSRDLNIKFIRRELEIYYNHRVGPLLERWREGWETADVSIHGESPTIRGREDTKRKDVQSWPSLPVDNQK
jgi:hypothetical protein